jgi:hypothetical protein
LPRPIRIVGDLEVSVEGATEHAGPRIWIDDGIHDGEAMKLFGVSWSALKGSAGAEPGRRLRRGRDDRDSLGLSLAIDALRLAMWPWIGSARPFVWISARGSVIRAA